MKTMKQNYFLSTVAAVTILFFASNQLSAQTVPGSTVNVTKGVNTVKVIDNKGTIKYFQSNNGITQITNTTADKTTTTWQLGGVLTDDTYIDATGKTFGLTGLSMTALTPSLDGTTAGYTLIVSNALTGKLERILATTLVQGGVKEKELVADSTTDYVIVSADLAGLTTAKEKISLYRNGIKLRQTDFTLAAGAITIVPTTNLPLYSGDVLEIQWVK